MSDIKFGDEPDLPKFNRSAGQLSVGSFGLLETPEVPTNWEHGFTVIDAASFEPIQVPLSTGESACSTDTTITVQ